MFDKLLITVLVILAVVFTTGTAQAESYSPRFIAYASTLSPEPVIPTPPPAIVEEKVIEVSTSNFGKQSPQNGPQEAENQENRPLSGLLGSIGYASPYGNCVNEPGVKRQKGNPITWVARTGTPYIGATFLFYSNHTGVVTGIWSNGDIEVRHQNYQGGQHRFSRSMFRGFI